jgi:branched-chain amino acid transport system ATP-binding protein
MLELDDVHAYYGDSHVLHGVSMRVAPGEVVALLGPQRRRQDDDGAHDHGLPRAAAGRVTYDGAPLNGMPPHAIARRGFGFVPQERGIFPSLTVEENLTVAAAAATAGGRCRSPTSCSRGSPSARRTSGSSSPAASSRCSRSRAR